MDRIWCIVKSLPYMLPHNNQIWLPSRMEPKVPRASQASACACSAQAKQPSVIGNLVEQSLLLAHKIQLMLADVRES